MKIKNSILEILHGDILSIESDAIYCPDTVNIAMNFGLSNIIKSKTRNEVYYATREKVPIKLGDVLHVESMGLTVSHIFFGAVMENNGEISRDMVEKTIYSSLKLCSDLSLKRISFPMISSPKSKVPFDIYSKIILKAIFEFLYNNENVSLNINMVMFNDEAFSNAKMNLDMLRQVYLI